MLDVFLSHLFRKSPLQEKAVSECFLDIPEAREELNIFLETYRPLWQRPEVGGLEGLADAYLRMVGQFMMCRKDFMRTGMYSMASQSGAFEAVYGNPDFMLSYMLGVAVSQYLWRAHFLLFRFFKRCLSLQNPSGRFLEVGSGPGLHLQYTMSKVAPQASIDIVDISAVSIQLTKLLLQATNPPALERVQFTEADVTRYNPGKSYDFIEMGEVLEHVDDPASLLKGLHRLLAEKGALFITTCINCPAPDHVYLFHTLEEIRDMVHACAYAITEEVVIPSLKDKSFEYHMAHKLDISYGALLSKSPA